MIKSYRVAETSLVVEAVKYDDSINNINVLLDTFLISDIEDGNIYIKLKFGNREEQCCKRGDYIVKNIKGDIYFVPCKIFKQFYKLMPNKLGKK